jgi:thiamine-phosphate pyrophosphorylase
MKLIVITTETFSDREPEAIRRLFESGMEILHVRKPRASCDETKRFIRRIDAVFHPRMVLHDHYELTDLFDLKGIHLNRRNYAAYHRLCSGRRLSVSRSCHSLEEIADASAKLDYLFLSPVFDSISKTGYKRRYTPEELNGARERGVIDGRVIALGGVTAERIPAVRRYGFGGVAVLGSLWAGSMDGLKERFDELRRKCADD